MSRISTRVLAATAGVLMVAGSAAATTGAAQAAPAAGKKVDAAKLFNADLVPELPTPVRGAARGAGVSGKSTSSSGSVSTLAAPANGSYISYAGRAFKIVGGAPLYVSSWANVPKGTVTAVTAAQFNALRWFPADGTFVTATDGKVYRFVAGAPFYVTSWAVYGKAQPTIAIDKNDIVNAGKAFPWDGVLDITYDVGPRWNPDAGVLDFNGSVFISTPSGKVYKMVAGVPVYVSTWAAFGGAKTTIRVDQNTVDRAGQAVPFNIVQKHLPDNILLLAAQSGQVFFSAGGSPQYLSSASLLVDSGYTWVASAVDRYAIEKAGSAIPNNNLLRYPAHGTYLLGADPTRGIFYYQVQNGAPIAIDPWADDFEDYALVDQAVIDNAGGPSPYSHLLAPPA
jgi:hypothetical protein